MLNEAEILQFLECTPGAPGIRQLNRLVRAYVRKVPWESVFRIAKRASTPELSLRPRWPDEFWEDAMRSGGGGTCFESNYAFFQLLKQLGYTGYLTVNDMGEQRGCHSAIIIHLDGQKVLVDVGIPLQAALHIDPRRVTRCTTWLHTYTIRPDEANRYQVERSRHPNRNIYTLIDTPIAEPHYCRIVEQDYGETGLFLNRVILVKVIEDRLWRFNSDEMPYRLEGFGRQDRQEIPIPSDQAIRMLSEHFRMDAGKIEAALRALNQGGG
jgi:arylamine N-acetyltransferase